MITRRGPFLCCLPTVSSAISWTIPTCLGFRVTYEFNELGDSNRIYATRQRGVQCHDCVVLGSFDAFDHKVS